MDEQTPTVFIIDDDEGIRVGMSRLLSAAGWKVEAYGGAEAFLGRDPYLGAGCVLLDVHMPGLNGMQLHEELLARGIGLPVVFLTGLGDVPTSVRAMKRGAVDFLTKPIESAELFAALEQALQRHTAQMEQSHEAQLAATRLDRLSAREREVLELVAGGRLNKQIAAELGIAEKTVKVHRGRVMEKMEVRSVAALVRLLERSGHAPTGPTGGGSRA